MRNRIHRSRFHGGTAGGRCTARNCGSAIPISCCTMRKVVPLQSKLQDLDCWITGLRRNQSETRADIGVMELYAQNGNGGPDIVKLN